METVRKIVSTDMAKSHMQGLLPFIEGGKITFLDTSFPDGNWGKYVCDFGFVAIDTDNINSKFFDGFTLSNGVQYRYKYANLIRHYSYINKLLLSGTILKGITKLVPDTYEENTCSGVVKTYKTITSWTDTFTESVNKYNYVPMNFYDFQKNGDKGYDYIGSNEELLNKINGYIILIGADEPKEYINNDIVTSYPDFVGRIKSYNDEWKEWNTLIGEDTSSFDDYFQLSKDVESKYIGVLPIPTNIKGKYVPDLLQYADITEWLQWFEKNSLIKERECCIEKKTYIDNGGTYKTKFDNSLNPEWVEHGGDAMYDFLNQDNIKQLYTNTLLAISQWETNGKKYLSPYMSIPVFFDEEYKDEGLMTIYDDSNYSWGSDTCKDSLIESKFIQLSGGSIESELYSVRSKKYSSSDNGVLPGIFKEFSNPTYFKCTYNNGKWDSTEISNGSSLSCLDDETALNNPNVYYNLSITGEVASIFPMVNEGDFVNVMPMYDNSENSPMSIPYKEYEIHNEYITEYITDKQVEGIGDYITSISSGDGRITIDYNIGGKFIGIVSGNQIINATGITGYGFTLRESYPFYPAYSATTIMNDNEVVIYYDFIDTSGSAITVEDPDLGLRDNVLLAELTGLKVNDVISRMPECILFKKVENSGLNFDNNTDVSIEINRGSAAAFEKYFKLSECNTFEDLNNYGNSYFNIDNE